MTLNIHTFPVSGIGHLVQDEVGRAHENRAHEDKKQLVLLPLPAEDI